ncbi:hypothetical protein QAD02_012815, partial [Eretmocerus hayati]
MGGWSIPPFVPPFMPPHVTPTASIREVRDSETERDQRTTAGRSNDSSGDDTEYIRQQRDRLQGLRGSQTTNQVPSNTQAPPIVQTPVGARIQEPSQGADPRKVAATELEEATGQVAGLTVGNKPEAKALESKPPPATTLANPANANGGHKVKGRGGKKTENGTSAGEAAETTAVTTNATKSASTPAPTPSAPPPPTLPAPQAGPWGYPWGYPPHPYWQMPGASGMQRNARPVSAESMQKRQEQLTRGACFNGSETGHLS